MGLAIERHQTQETLLENEIRLVIDGHGVFSINPRTAPAFDVAMDPGDFISGDSNEHMFALYLLAEFREPAAFPAVVGLPPPTGLTAA